MAPAVTIFGMYYETATMLRKQLETWHSYPMHVKEQVEFVVVDDGSPSTPAVIDHAELNLTFARVKENVPWNHPGAQNLCAHLASGEWLVSCGIDHVLTPENVEALLRLDRTKERNYRIGRFTTDGKYARYHNAVNYLPRELFWRIGGYDEDFAGHWGADDVCFLNMLKKHSVSIVEVPPDQVSFTLYTEKDFLDANSHHHNDTVDQWSARKMNQRNRRLWLNKMSGKVVYGQNPLRFDWEIVRKFTL